ncbi:alpha/beta hydrolase [Actinoplanes sp. NPDC051411]|uniref:alpha/beta hydrolase family protein n=1 Tax=Actinoplanes sp. NPDC051411 TaxID=3155522 RepID=UPI003424764E
MVTRRRIGAALAMLLALAGCSGPASPPPPAATENPPATTFPVGVRILRLHRGSVRPLPTLVLYPAAPWTLAGTGTPADQPATGRFPLVVFSHGLKGSPERYQAALTGWAAAGFVVVAPTFPHTSLYAPHFRRSDITHQPDDVRYVVAQIRRLDATPADPLAGHIDTTRIAAIGHSAGGYTTMGLFTAGHDPSLKAGVVMAGWLAPGAFAGPPATMLFLQGTADPIVPAARSRAAFNRVPWPKAYLLLRHNSHTTYLQPGQIGYNLMESTVIDFLRWTLNGDQAARARLPHGTTAR